jgi:hypothetical protein
MSETERAKEIDEAVRAADAKRRADAEEAAMAGEKLDKILSHLDSMHANVDSLGKRMDAFEAARSKDEEGEGEMEDEIEKDKPKKLGADSQVRKDSAADAEEIAHFKAETGATHKIAADSVLAQIQTDADRASTAWGKDAPHPWEGETIVNYRRRVARLHQQHSPQWKAVDLRTLDGQSLRNAASQIFADSIAASESPASYPNTLVERRLRDPISGQTRIEFYGSPSAWTNQFKGGAMYVKAFKTGARYDRD